MKIAKGGPLKKSPEFWTAEDELEAETANTYAALLAVALRVIKRTDLSDPLLPLMIVCGPISTGGLGSQEQNLALFDITINRLRASGCKVFNQIPFERHIFRIKERLGDSGERLLLEFYLPLFESGLIKMMFFMKNWDTSNGASWEHREAKRLGIKIVYAPM